MQQKKHWVLSICQRQPAAGDQQAGYACAKPILQMDSNSWSQDKIFEMRMLSENGKEYS